MNKQNRRPNGITRRLRRMEDKLDILICDLNRIHVRLLAMEQNQREKPLDDAINTLWQQAKRMRELAEQERQAIKERYGL